MTGLTNEDFEAAPRGDPDTLYSCIYILRQRAGSFSKVSAAVVQCKLDSACEWLPTAQAYDFDRVSCLLTSAIFMLCERPGFS